MTPRRWLEATRRAAWRHKVATAAAFLCLVAAVVAGTVAGTSPGARTAPTAGGAGQGPAGTSAQQDLPAQPFSLPALGQPDRRVSLSDYVGRPVIVNFFASWCEACQQETPLLARFYRDHRGQVAIVGLDENDLSAAATKFVAAKGVTYPVGFDPGLTVASNYGVDQLPQTFFLNSAHQIVKRVFGAISRAQLTQGVALMDRASTAHHTR